MGAISQYLAGSIEQTSPIEEYTGFVFFHKADRNIRDSEINFAKGGIIHILFLR